MALKTDAYQKISLRIQHSNRIAAVVSRHQLLTRAAVSLLRYTSVLTQHDSRIHSLHQIVTCLLPFETGRLPLEESVRL